MLHGKRIVLGVTGSIAAYKAAMLCSGLVKKGAVVQVIMTTAAVKFISPLTFESLTHNPVHIDTFDEGDSAHITHIKLAETADVLLIAPASANILASMAHGIANDMLTNVFLATKATVIIAPAMNGCMLENLAVQSNIQTLRGRGVLFIESEDGPLACGYDGKGRLAEPEQIIAFVELLFAQVSPIELNEYPHQELGPLAGQSVLVTAGGTIERIDPVRYLTNDSSGKMGFAMAAEALRLGAVVTVIAARVQVPPPPGVNLISVESARDMYDAVLSLYHTIDIVIMAAAVADYRPAHRETLKMKKSAPQLILVLEKNPDILEELGRRKLHQFLVGFAAETENVEENALDKLRRKRLNLIVGNNVAQPGTGFGSDSNEVSVYDHTGLLESISLRSKSDVAARLLELIAAKVRVKRLNSVVSPVN